MEEFKNLFTGNPNAFGVYDWKNNKSFTKKIAPTQKEYTNHFSGAMGLGIIPVVDKEFSNFGVLDFDNHEISDGINLFKLSKKIADEKLPMVVCRSKSGGGHVYIFGKEKLKTKLLRSVLNNLIDVLKGHGEIEIEVFPKQDSVDKHIIGNWINLPYFGCKEGYTERYAIINNKIVYDVNTFITYCNSIRVSNDDLIKLVGDDKHAQAPPCIQEFLKNKIGQGQRNNALYNFCIYARKKSPDGWESMVYNFNDVAITPKLTYEEVNAVIKSVQRQKGYQYKCQENPCKMYCNAELCVKRQYGITSAEKSTLMLSDLPEFGKFIKYITEPVKYRLEVKVNSIEGFKSVTLSSNELLNFKYFRLKVFEQLDTVIKTVKADEWMYIVEELTKKIEYEELPDDASQSGLVRGYLEEFRKNSNCDDNVCENLEDRSAILDGEQVIISFDDKHTMQKKRYFCFRFPDFKEFLITKKFGNVLGENIYLALKEFNVESHTIRVKTENGNQVVNIWRIPLTDKNKIDCIKKEDKLIDGEGVNNGN